MSSKDCKDPKNPDQCEGASLCPSPPPCPPVQNITHPLRYYEFTEDEMRVLEECDRESFYGRCLPLSALFATLTYAAVKGGYVRRNLRFGAAPKMTLAVVLGYFIGKFSYSSQCADKLMALPGSYVGQLLREQRDGRPGNSTTPPQRTKSMLGAEASDIYSDAGPGFSLDLEADRPVFVLPRQPDDDAPRPTPDLHDAGGLPSDISPPSHLDPVSPPALPVIAEEYLQVPPDSERKDPVVLGPQLPDTNDPSRAA